MIAAASAVAGRLAEVAEHESGSEPPAWLIGGTAFVILIALLFIVTRFNRDR